jgi:hypothetical protein
LTPGPPNRGLSRQFLHVPQSAARHWAHTPHRLYATTGGRARGADGIARGLGTYTV